MELKDSPVSYDKIYKDVLKPCPFCGGEAHTTEHLGGMKSIGCKTLKCYGFGLVFSTEQAATEAWNKRVDKY